jgi:hypothetical protein
MPGFSGAAVDRCRYLVCMRGKARFGLLGLCALAAACGSTTGPSASSAPLRIQNLSGSVAKLGSWEGSPLYGVRLRATVCVGSPKALYPDIGITHFVLSGSPTRKWWRIRTVVDSPPWLVPLQESWQGKECGPVQIDDPIPPEHTGGVEQLGNPYSCYGVAFTIKTGTASASKRAIIQCGGIGGRATCSPDQLVAPPWVVGQAQRLAVKHLRDAGFRVTVFPESKPKTGVPIGVVTRQEPDHGLGMCRRADISIVVAVAKK